MIKDEWHLDKSVSVGHLLTTVMLVAAAVGAFYSLSERMSVVENKIVTLLENQIRIDARQDHDLDIFRDQMRASVGEVNNKLDLLIDRMIE